MKHKKKILITLAVVIVFIGIYILYSNYKTNNDSFQYKNGKFSYSQFRDRPKYDMVFREKNGTNTIYNISFSSRNFMNLTTIIHGIVYLPDVTHKVPGVVLLPGGGGTKENEWALATLIADQGYAVLVIDQRGIGETGGYYISYDEDEKIFGSGREPMQYLAVYDILRSYDVLKHVKGVDSNKITVAGESMGARYAIIAAGIDKNIKGVMAISSSGFHLSKLDPSVSNYYLSVDPDNYISDISPNYVVMIHGNNDTMIQLKDAKITFDKAKEPKKFASFDSCGHGYCHPMDDEIKADLKLMFNLK